MGLTIGKLRLPLPPVPVVTSMSRTRPCFRAHTKKIRAAADFALDKAVNVATLSPATCKFFTNAVIRCGVNRVKAWMLRVHY
jgi:hypothetical protein